MSADDVSGTAAEQSPSTTFTTFTTESRTSSQRSSLSSSDSPSSTAAAPAAVTTATTTEQAPRFRPQVDVLLRDYPRPAEELDMDALLARPPPKLSLRRYVETWREVRVPATDKEAQTKAFLEAKRELLQSAAKSEGRPQPVKERSS